MDIAQKIFGVESRWGRKFVEKRKLFTGKMSLKLKKRIKYFV